LPYAAGVLLDEWLKPARVRTGPATQPTLPDEILARRRGVGQRTS